MSRRAIEPGEWPSIKYLPVTRTPLLSRRAIEPGEWPGIWIIFTFLSPRSKECLRIDKFTFFVSVNFYYLHRMIKYYLLFLSK